ncbi:baculoviral IAP repeat-containing protein 7-like [Ylistrum balloti]|uniref:baculoviral IAP repeat-containing protein 7-like n=1 Tax=Ylistrum balloti TaxID=509963 RepID=UPI002905B26C|nr:baculoviral IAP repeat-containing protein 7-like [Ylistrum balloti]
MDIAPPPPKERYKHLRDPVLRKKSFGKWQNISDPFLKDLVNDGLFSIDEVKRKVQCIYCGGVLCGIEEGQNVHITHYRHFPKCDRFKFREPDFLKLFNGSQVINGEYCAKHILGTNGCARNARQKQEICDESFVDGRGFDKYNSVYTLEDKKYPKHSYYSLWIDRLRTFRNWPTHLKQTPEDLARAGFFYTGVDDVCECYCCGGQLDGWEEDDQPQKEHDRWFSDVCPLYMAR